MLNLSSITLLCVETRNPELALWTIEKCLVGTRFSKVVLVTNLDLVKERKAGIDYVQAPSIRTTKDYSEFLLNEIEQHVLGTHVLIIQWDSFITNPHLWRDEFLNYDYVGPVWPHHPETPVGNGGFSLRSVKLLKAIKQPKFVRKHPEDYCICAENKVFLENDCGIQFAPIDVAEQFAVERTQWHDAFGFHGFFNFGRVLNSEDLLAFLDTLPNSYLSGVDSFDLVDYLLANNMFYIAEKITDRISFTWRLRKRYVLLMIRLTLKKLSLAVLNNRPG